MSDKAELAKIYVKAQADGSEESIAALEPHLAEDVLLTMALGPVDGKAAVLTQMKNPVTMYNFTVGTWQEPVVDGESVKMTSSMPIQATLGGFNLTFNYTPEGMLHRVLMQPLPAPPMPVSELRLTDEITQIVNEAPTKGAFAAGGGGGRRRSASAVDARQCVRVQRYPALLLGTEHVG